MLIWRARCSVAASCSATLRHRMYAYMFMHVLLVCVRMQHVVLSCRAALRHRMYAYMFMHVLLVCVRMQHVVLSCRAALRHKMHACMHAYVCMHVAPVYMYVYIHIYIYICLHICIYIYTYIYGHGSQTLRTKKFVDKGSLTAYCTSHGISINDRWCHRMYVCMYV
jgi:hypothetical protein